MTKSFSATLGLGMAVAGTIALAPAANAALTITNGDFESGITDQSTNADVDSWFSVTTGDFFANTWHDSRDAEVPTDSESGFSGEAAAAFSGAAGGGQPQGQTGSWLYQGIGTADVTDTTLPIQFDWGDFGNGATARDLGLTVSVYEYDGIGTFSAGNENDIEGQESIVGSGVTELDFVSFSETSPTSLFLSTGEIANLDLTGHTGGELYLRFNNWDNGGDTPWLMVDNVSIVPEPSIALLGGFGLLCLLRRRRN